MKKVLIINSHYYKDITNNLVIAGKNILKKNKLSVSIVNAPGIFEIRIGAPGIKGAIGLLPVNSTIWDSVPPKIFQIWTP